MQTNLDSIDKSEEGVKQGKFIIYHNPKCSKSRQTLAILEGKGINPEIIRYLETPLSADEIRQLLAQSGLSAKAVLRDNEDSFKALNLNAEELSEQQIIVLMAENPKLLNRPFVVTDKGARLCRPPELVFEIL